jgi:hypothetical protein
MDFVVWAKFDDDIERLIHVDDVVSVEMPFESEFFGGSVLVEFNDQEIWAYLAKSELWKVEKYKPQVIERTAKIRIAARTVRRNPLLQWLAKQVGGLRVCGLPALLKNWDAST